MTVQNQIGGSGGVYVPPGRTVLSRTVLEVGSPFSGWCAFCKLGGLGNGNALAAWARATDVNGDSQTGIWTSATTNGGSTWSTPSQAFSGAVLPAGLLCCSNNTLVKAVAVGTATKIATSTDNGSSWSSLATMSAASFTGSVSLASSAPIQVGSTLYLALYGTDMGSSDFYIRIVSSPAPPATLSWSDTGVAIRPPSGTSFAEPWLLALDSGPYLMTIRKQPTGAGGNVGEQMYTSTSSSLTSGWSTPALSIDQCGASPATIQTPELDVWAATRDMSTGAGNSMVVPSYTHRGSSWGFTKDLSGNSYQYGQFAYIGASGADGSLCLVVGENNSGVTSPVFYEFSKLNGSPSP